MDDFEMDPQPEDFQALLTSGYRDPWLVRWAETGDLEVVAGPLLRASTHLEEDEHYYVVTTAGDARRLVGLGDDDVPTEDDYAELTRLLGPGGRL